MSIASPHEAVAVGVESGGGWLQTTCLHPRLQHTVDPLHQGVIPVFSIVQRRPVCRCDISFAFVLKMTRHDQR